MTVGLDNLDDEKVVVVVAADDDDDDGRETVGSVVDLVLPRSSVLLCESLACLPRRRPDYKRCSDSDFCV